MIIHIDDRFLFFKSIFILLFKSMFKQLTRSTLGSVSDRSTGF